LKNFVVKACFLCAICLPCVVGGCAFGSSSVSTHHAGKTVSQPPAPLPEHNADFTFTNELGRRVNLSEFSGQALALDFIFTRCPVPQYCPRLSRNFAEASQRLGSLPGLATNWHFLSITFDPDFDTPDVLRAYAQRYNYDPNQWSFLTGPKDRIASVCEMFGIETQPDIGGFKHTFRTVVINTSNRVQQIIPVAGDFSDQLVHEMITALGSTNR